MPISFFYSSVIGLVLSAAFLGCSAGYKGNIPASQLDTEVNSAKKAETDSSVERTSESIQQFLMAELFLAAEQPEEALESLTTASRLLDTPDPQIQLNLAKLYLSKEEPKNALKALSNISSDLQVLELKAALLQTLQQWAAALETYREILLIKPDQAEARLMLALDSLQRKQSIEAVPLLQGIIVKDNKNLAALKLLAFCYRELGDYQKSLSLLEQIRQLDPADSSVFKSLLSIALMNQNYLLIERELQRETRINPTSQILPYFGGFDWKNPKLERTQTLLQNLKSDSLIPPTASDLRYEMARLALLKQNFPEAVVHFSLLLAEKPNDDELRYTLALALSSSGRSKEAIAHLDNIDSDSPWFVRAQAFAGMLHRQKDDYKLAEQSFRRALSAEPKSEQLQSYLATVLRDAKKLDVAKRVYQEALESDPTNQKVLFNYGTLLYEIGQPKEGYEVMHRLIGLNPQHAEALNFIAYSLAEEGRELERALDLANRAIQLQLENGFFIDTRGWVYFKMGRHKEAVADLEHATDLTKGDAEITEHLADVYLSVGRRDDALENYKNALDSLVNSSEDSDKVSAQRIKKKIEELTR